MWLSLSQVSEVVEVIQPALSILEKTVITSLLVVSWAIAVAAVVFAFRVTNKAQEGRVSDYKDLTKQTNALASKMTTAFERMKGALDGLKRAEESGQEVTKSIKAAIDAMQNTMNLLLLSMGKRPTPPSMPAPRGGRESGR